MILDNVNQVCAVMLLCLVVGILGVGVYKLVSTEPVMVTGEPLPLVATTIAPGDTFWGLAKELYPNQRPDKVVEAIRELNPDLDPGRLMPGQTVWLPQEV